MSDPVGTNDVGLVVFDTEPTRKHLHDEEEGHEINSTTSSSRSVRINDSPMYHHETDRSSVLSEEKVVMERENGTRVIITRDHPTYHHPKFHLSEKKLEIIVILSYVSVVVFFPTGIPAMLSARKADQQFYSKGVERGDMDLARKYAQRSQNLIIASVVLVLLVICLVLAVMFSGGSVARGIHV